MSYNDKFYDSIRDITISSARVVVPIVLMRLHEVGRTINSVIDVGCGQGWWAKEFSNCGVKRVLGIDGDYVKDPVVPFMALDLSERAFVSSETFDLAVCLEVGEHLPEQRAHGLVASLCLTAPVILWSAAIPEQGGENHINEQPPSYWERLFRANGFVMSGFLRDFIWDDTRVASWYRQNLMLAVEKTLPLPAGFWGDVPPKERIHPATGNPRLARD